MVSVENITMFCNKCNKNHKLNAIKIIKEGTVRITNVYMSYCPDCGNFLTQEESYIIDSVITKFSKEAIDKFKNIFHTHSRFLYQRSDFKPEVKNGKN